jgi:DNA-binding FadR family transcriptional regulator
MRAPLDRPADEFVELDQRFHLAVARATHNPSLEIVVEPILRPLRDRMRASLHLAEVAEQAMGEHEAIATVIGRGDARAAAAAMGAHLTRVSEEIRQLQAAPAHPAPPAHEGRPPRRSRAGRRR